MATATFAAGCFWSPEAKFRRLPGVLDTQVGYTGGTTPNPSYEQVCTGRTGHAEAVKVTYDPERIGYDRLLEAFWGMHDPTQKDRQGPDIGTQYRSAIFPHDADQQRLAEESLAARQAETRKPIATRIEPAGDWWPAEDYHQQFYEKRGMVG
ncbi:MAG: peptide-methionine (S)-S-oxide reductase MsrA [Alphaproteobacteria bacterium]|jgi:peptide-methionine (S)-S-oxide reductase|nr:peptide-methionine (S)-S-oxide reductase MsrA [Alphaproteobacteria bacterium]